MPTGDANDQWYLEVNGKKFGPYTLAQIEALARHNEILGQDKVTASHLNGKWMTVDSFVRQTGAQKQSPQSSQSTQGSQAAQATPATPAAVPPRPDERTLTSLLSPSNQAAPRKSSTDAVSNLFEILQAARERKPQTPNAVGHAVMDKPQFAAESSPFAPLMWVGIPAMVLVAILTWKFSGSTNSNTISPDEPSVAKRTTEQAPKKSTPSDVVIAAPKAASAPVAKTTAVVSQRSSGFAAGRLQQRPTLAANASSEKDRERDREKERELEREREREREREAEREQERERERDSAYARNNSSMDSGSRDRSDMDRNADRNSDRTDRMDRSTASVNRGAPGSTNANYDASQSQNGNDSGAYGQGGGQYPQNNSNYDNSSNNAAPPFPPLQNQ
jgi:hypothetical protein